MHEDDDVELENLRVNHDAYNDEDDAFVADDDNRALLDGHGKTNLPTQPSTPKDLWSQAQGILIEVGTRTFLVAGPSRCSERTNIIPYDYQSVVHRGTIG